MSAVPKGKLPLPELAAMKAPGDRIVMVTAYDAPGARFAEDAGVDAILVGDTAAMVVLGYDGTTVPVTMDEMVFLARTVARAFKLGAAPRRLANFGADLRHFSVGLAKSSAHRCNRRDGLVIRLGCSP